VIEAEVTEFRCIADDLHHIPERTHTESLQFDSRYIRYCAATSTQFKLDFSARHIINDSRLSMPPQAKINNSSELNKLASVSDQTEP
jgi:hypothetical protein